MAVNLRGLRVLVVEDRAYVAMALCAVLKDQGCTVVGPCARLQHAMQLAAEEQIDIGLLDVDLDGEFSYPVAETLRQRHVPVVLLTGMDLDTTPPEFADLPVIAKPVGTAELLQSISDAAGRSV